MGLLHDLDDGKKREIAEEDFDYFLDVLPPAAMGFRWNGEKWAFGFAEGADYVYAFKKEGGKYYAQKTGLMNPGNAASRSKTSSRDSLRGSRRRGKPASRETRGRDDRNERRLPATVSISERRQAIYSAYPYSLYR